MSAWIVTRSYDPAYIRDIETEAGEIVAQVLDLDDYASDLKRARLIAAAPDLLAALELIEIDKEGDGFICAEAMGQVRAALNKARGET